MDNYDMLRLSNQLCFPLYVCAKEVVRAYKPYLDELGLTYTQYITMMVMWERERVRVKELGECLYLESSTLTPLLKCLEEKGYVSMKRSEKDERDMIVSLTEKGRELKKQAASVPGKMAACINTEPGKAKLLYDMLYEIIGKLNKG
ncbi:MAG: MarR family transcriptional regulator [Ruminococcus sp.]|nr:MarR family transcriptional regulator [Ruminococcus sp.]